MNSIRNLNINKNEIIGLVAGIIPFFIFIGSSSSRTVNGAVVSSSSFNLVAIVGGAIALFLAFSGLKELSRQPQNERLLHVGIMIVMVLLGIFQLLRGIGIVA